MLRLKRCTCPLLKIDWDLCYLDLVPLRKVRAVLDKRMSRRLEGLPLVWSQEVVGRFDRLVSRNEEVHCGLGVAD